MGKLANIEIFWIKNYLIKTFIKKYRVNLSEAALKEIAHYKTFNDFFIRKLDSAARIISSAKLVSPVDGCISEIGVIKNNKMLQVKGHSYFVASLVNDQELANKVANGLFATLYLAPKDYHRIHMPISGELVSMRYVPGKLFSVNFQTVALIPDIFALNERVILEFATSIGTIIVILVGATIVGSISTTWYGDFIRGDNPWTINYRISKNKIILEKGQELGYFKLGSTVILLIEPKQGITWKSSLCSKKNIVLGEAFIE